MVTPPPERQEPELIAGEPDASGRWKLELRKDPHALEHPIATCPSGMYCVHAPADLAGASAAPEPYATCANGRDPFETFRADLTKSERERVADACCYSWYKPCPGGRPLRDGGEPLLARAVERSDWSSRDGLLAAPPAVARHYLEQAATEHASVASFSRFSLQLLALGAPAALVEASHEAALDEIRHAALCFSLAARFSGERRGPGPLPLPTESASVDARAVLLETLRDGCLGEAFAARVLEAAGQSALDDELRAILTRMAEDEERHAELAFRAVAWLVEHHPELRPTLAAFVFDLEERLSATEPARITDAGGSWTEAARVAGAGGSWEPTVLPSGSGSEVLPAGAEPAVGHPEFGLLSSNERERLEREVAREVVLPCLAAFLAA